MKLVVGLGNPGIEYERTRHNVGWWVLAHLADVWRFPPWRTVPDARAADAEVEGRNVRLLAPQTFMNLSGDALAPYVHRPFWSVANDLLVVVDDVALPVGTFRFRARGSAGGHNGLRSIEAALGTQDYARLRIGVGPDAPVPGDVLRDFVLGEFADDDATRVRERFPVLQAAIATWITDGIVLTMNRFPGRPAAPEPERRSEEPRVELPTMDRSTRPEDSPPRDDDASRDHP